MSKYLVKIILHFFDKFTQKKLLNVLKKKFKNNLGSAIDVGAHHGETIKFLINNFSPLRLRLI